MEDILGALIPIVAIVMVFGMIIIINYFKHKERMMGHMSEDQMAELDRMSKLADILDQRVHILEKILDDEVPNWRERNDKTI